MCPYQMKFPRKKCNKFPVVRRYIYICHTYTYVYICKTTVSKDKKTEKGTEEWEKLVNPGQS